MSLFHDLVERARALVFRRREEQELDEELRFHLEMEAEYQRQSGASAEDARRRSVIALGGVEQTKEEIRDARGTRWLEDLAADIGFAFRTIRRAPGFAVTLVLMLGIGIGANTAIFTLIDAVVLRELPVLRPKELVAIGDPSMVNSSGQGWNPVAMSYPLYRDVRDHGGSFTGVLAAGPASRLDVLIDGPDAELEHPKGRFVSGNYFSVLGVPAWRGRVFDGSEDDEVGGSPVVTISHGYWTRRFRQDSSIVGKAIVVNDARLTIIGVAPPSFTGEAVGVAPDLWVPIAMHDVLKPNDRRLDRPDAIWLLLMGRLAPEVTLEQARADIGPFIIRTIAAHAPGGIAQTFLARNPEVPIGAGNRGLSAVRAAFELPLLTLMIGVAVLLGIICANVANLLLVRAVARGKEMAVRLALGAGRGRLVRLLLTETLVLTLLAVGVGLVLARWGSRVLLVLASGNGTAIPLDLTLDARALAFTLLISILTVAVFGLAPAIRASRMAQGDNLRTGARGGLGRRGTRRSLGGLLIGGQVAFSVVLLVGAAMLTRSLRNLQSVDVGMDRDHLLILELDVGARGYRLEPLAVLTHRIRDQLATIPGVTAVAFSENGLFLGSRWRSTVAVPGFAGRTAADSTVDTDNVGPDYIRGIGGRLLAGRDISAGDEGRPVQTAVVNQSFATFYYPAGNAVGSSFLLAGATPITIVGVVADVRDRTLEGNPDRRVYFPYVPIDTVISNPVALRFAIRTHGDPSGLVEQVRKGVIAIDPLLPIDELTPLGTLMRQSIKEQRLVTHLTSVFGVLALLLAGMGLYGVMTYAIKRRTGELGLRSALGAQRADILRLVLTEALGLVLTGMAVGLPLALASTRLLQGQLHGIESVDPLSIGLALSVLAMTAVVATLVPALAASRVAPVVALQVE